VHRPLPSLSNLLKKQTWEPPLQWPHPLLEPQSELPPEPTPTVPLVSHAVPANVPQLSAQLTMEEKLQNAAAVAARLSALVKSVPPEPLETATETPPGPFRINNNVGCISI
jgi:hypothetical protein